MAHQNPTASRYSDRGVLDAIALVLGTAVEWSPDHLEAVADLVGKARPHPGSFEDPNAYESAFETDRERSEAGTG